MHFKCNSVNCTWPTEPNGIKLHLLRKNNITTRGRNKRALVDIMEANDRIRGGNSVCRVCWLVFFLFCLHLNVNVFKI